VRGSHVRRWPLAACLLLTACCGVAETPRVPDPKDNGPIVDVHCHLFNAKDLPVAGFLRAQGVPGFLALLVDRIIQGQTDGTRSAAAVKDRTQPSDEEIDRVLEAVQVELEGESAVRVEAETREQAAERAELVEALAGGQGVARVGPRGTWGVIRRHARWAILLTAGTQEIARRMLGAYPDVALFTPCLMDMEHWFNDSVGRSFEDQIAVAEQAMTLAPGRIHPFLAYDPERARWVRAAKLDPLDLVRKALSKGFVGIKVYPPLGYRPTRNTNDPMAGPRGKAWDDELEALFAFCEAEEVPIGAHCEDPGAASSPAAGKYADPRGWDTVLAKHCKLRLNLMHFGGDTDLIERGASSWAWHIGQLVQKYPHVYADIGAHESLFDECQRADFLGGVEKIRQAVPAIGDHLMYGSDWHMIVRHPTEQRFLVDALEHMRHVERRRFAGGAALDYLGLLPGGKNRARLRTFYETKGWRLPSWWVEPGTP